MGLLTALLVLAVAPLVGPATPSSAKARVVVATGSVTCTTITGTVTFSPPVRHVGTRPETQTVSIRASHCRTSKSNVARVTGGRLVAAIHRPSNNCSDLLVAESPKSTGTWTPSSVHSTTASFSGFSFVTNGVGDIGFTLPNAGGKARVTGSFAGKDHGARSHATVYLNMTAHQFVAGCLSAAGVAREVIIGGSATFG